MQAFGWLLLFALRFPDAVALPAVHDESPGIAIPDGGLFDHDEERGPHMAPVGVRDLSKKARWLADKRIRVTVHVTGKDLERARLAALRTERKRRAVQPPGDAGWPLPWEGSAPAIGARSEPVVTLFNVRTRESLAILPGHVDRDLFHTLLRDHFTNQATKMDLVLLETLSRAAVHFKSERIDIVSGYRSPKYNLILRKKGRQVARDSQHCLGNAVDFRVSGVPTPALYRFVRGLQLGGVGIYPDSGFVHCDTGPTRFWKGS